MNFKKIICILMSMLVLFCSVSCGESEEGVPDGCVEISTDGVGYNFYMLESWKVLEKSGITSAAYSDFDTSNISIMGFDTGDTTSAEEYWNLFSKDFTGIFGEMTYEEEGTDTTFGGIPAKKYIYTVNFGGVDYKYMQIVCYKMNSAILTSQPEVYVFTYTALADKYDENIEDVIYMVENITFE